MVGHPNHQLRIWLAQGLASGFFCRITYFPYPSCHSRRGAPCSEMDPFKHWEYSQTIRLFAVELNQKDWATSADRCCLSVPSRMHGLMIFELDDSWHLKNVVISTKSTANKWEVSKIWIGNWILYILSIWYIYIFNTFVYVCIYWYI